MDLTNVTEEIARAMGRAERSDAEIALAQGAAVLATVLIGLLRAFDTVLEAWPLPFSRTHR